MSWDSNLLLARQICSIFVGDEKEVIDQRCGLLMLVV